MLVQFGPFDGRAVRFNNSANIKGLTEEFAGNVNSGIPRPRGARDNSSIALSKDHVPHHWLWLLSLLIAAVP
jgi:hypothetical protein